MKPFVTLLFIIISSAITTNAQTYLEHLKQKTNGQGTVTVNQSKQIDELVNGKKPKEKEDNTPSKTTSTKTTTSPSGASKATPEKSPAQHHSGIAQEKATTKEEKTTSASEKENTETSTVDMRKKVMRGSYKITGYRVQAYAGGNSRNDRLKAEQIGNAIKMKYPEQPIYVHFYSPRWICRVGNFRTLAEANDMLKKVRAMGYKQASLVKGQITVQY